MSLLLAAHDRMQGLFHAFRSTQNQFDGDDIFYGLLILFAVVCPLIFISIWVYRRRRRQASTSPRALFFSLCRAHRLKWSEYLLLWRLGQSQHLADPARLFVEPERFDISRLPVALRLKAEKLKNIHARLFTLPKGGVLNSSDAVTTAIPSTPPVGAALPLPATAPTLDLPLIFSPVLPAPSSPSIDSAENQMV
jgi:hypothetical protein